jgi:hypothetical protein
MELECTWTEARSDLGCGVILTNVWRIRQTPWPQSGYWVYSPRYEPKARYRHNGNAQSVQVKVWTAEYGPIDLNACVMSSSVKNENFSAKPKTKQFNLTAPYYPERRNGSLLSSLIKLIFNSTQGCRSLPWRQNI